MTASRDPDRLIRAFIDEGEDRLDDQVYDAVRAVIEQNRQRVIFGPWRTPSMNKFVTIGLGAAAVVVLLFVGVQLIGPGSGGLGGAPSATSMASPSPTQFGGTANYESDEGTGTTEIDAVADGASVSGTAVTTLGSDTHAVRLECAIQSDEYWAVGGTIEETTVPGESAGHWSAVIVKDGSPQRIAIWLSDSKAEGSDCDGWLASHDFAGVDPGAFQPVESGELMPPPDLTP